MELVKVNMNPKGIKASDCVVRAIAYATTKSWDDTYKGLCDLGFKMKRMPNEKRVYEKYLELNGWVKHKQPKTADYEDGWKVHSNKYTVNDFMHKMSAECKSFYRGRIIISVAKHLTCIDPKNYEYRLIDTWDCGHKCVGNYWTKGE